MVRFREIASVRLPGNRCRRRHMSPKGIRPGTWSRRWTVNLVTAGEDRRAVVFINKSFLIFNLWVFWNFQNKKYMPNLKFEMFEKHPEVGKNENLRKKISSLIWDFQLSMIAIYIRITTRILHLRLELLILAKNISKLKISLFQNYSAIEVWAYSFSEAKDQWGYF